MSHGTPQHGRAMTCAEIAAQWGCSVAYITLLERRALQKMRQAVAADPELRVRLTGLLRMKDEVRLPLRRPLKFQDTERNALTLLSARLSDFPVDAPASARRK